MGLPLTRPTLSEPEKASPLWVKLRTYYRAKLVIARQKNDGFLSDETRLPILMEIHTAKAILALEDDPPMTAAP